MEWVQFVIFFIGVGGLWLWQRIESRTETRRIEDWLKSHRELISEIYKEGVQWRAEMVQHRHDMLQEQKDFHYRLLEIERMRK